MSSLTRKTVIEAFEIAKGFLSYLPKWENDCLENEINNSKIAVIEYKQKIPEQALMDTLKRVIKERCKNLNDFEVSALYFNFADPKYLAKIVKASLFYLSSKNLNSLDNKPLVYPVAVLLDQRYLAVPKSIINEVINELAIELF